MLPKFKLGNVRTAKLLAIMASQSWKMSISGQSFPKVAMRRLQVLSIVLLISYSYHLAKPLSSVFGVEATNSNEESVENIGTYVVENRTVSDHGLRKEEIVEWLRTKIKCDNRKHGMKVYQKLDYWVVENFLKATHGDMDCRQTVTLAITGEFPDLENLMSIVQRWHAPISLALYCARPDYQNCLDSLLFIRTCLPVDSQRYFLIKYLSVHLFFEDTKIPENIYRGFRDTRRDCTVNPMERRRHHSTTNDIYRHSVGSNIAKEGALTHYVLSSDIEMLPSFNIHTAFMEMIALSGSIAHPEGTVYLLPVFQMINGAAEAPLRKSQVLEMLDKRQLSEWNEELCRDCHRVLNVEEWMHSPRDAEFSMLPMNIEKRKILWNAYYIGTRDNPYFDENYLEFTNRTQQLIGVRACAKDFQFAVLNDAFVVRNSVQPEHKMDTAIRVGWRDNIYGLRSFLKEIDLKCSLYFMMQNRIK